MKEIKLADYRDDVERLLKYLPWLESHVSTDVSHIYDANGLADSSVVFPVYDSTLLNFVNEASKTGLMDQNYVYVFSQNFIRNLEDEKQAIERATIKDCEVLTGILSKYVLGGMTKGRLWSEAVSSGIWVLVLRKMKKLLEIWDSPLA